MGNSLSSPGTDPYGHNFLVHSSVLESPCLVTVPRYLAENTSTFVQGTEVLFVFPRSNKFLSAPGKKFNTLLLVLTIEREWDPLVEAVSSTWVILIWKMILLH